MNLLIEEASSGNVLGSFEEINEKYGYNIKKIVALNRSGKINIIDSHSKRLNKRIERVDKTDGKKYRFQSTVNYYSCRKNQRVINLFIKDYLTNELLLSVFFQLILLNAIYLNLTGSVWYKYLVVMIISFGTVYTNLFHELGHCFFIVHWADSYYLSMSGMKVKIYSETSGVKQRIVIAIGGALANLLIVLICVSVILFCRDFWIKINICLCVAINQIQLLNILPLFSDGKSLVKNIMIFIRIGVGNEKIVVYGSDISGTDGVITIK